MAHKYESFVNSQRRGTVSEISSRWQNALSKSELCDVEFAVGRLFGAVKRLRAHKLTLSISSDVFYTMFNGSLAERAGIPIDIPDIPADAFTNMLSYIYTGAVEDLQPENAVQTLYCADKYDLPWLAEYCTDFILDDLKADNCLMYLENAKSWTPDCDVVVEKCLDIVDASTAGVFQSDYFIKLERKTLELILQRSTLSAEENVIYMAVEEWAKAACLGKKVSASATNRRQALGPVFFLIRFALLTDAQLTNGPVKSGLLNLKEMRKVLIQKHGTDADASKEGPLAFSKEPRKLVTCRFLIRYTYKLMEKTFVLYTEGSYYPAMVTGIDEVDYVWIYEMEAHEEKGLVSVNCHHSVRASVRAADILKRGLPVEVYIDGEYKKATYGSLRAGRHTVCVGDREYSVEFTKLKIARADVEKWLAGQQ